MKKIRILVSCITIQTETSRWQGLSELLCRSDCTYVQSGTTQWLWESPGLARREDQAVFVVSGHDNISGSLFDSHTYMHVCDRVGWINFLRTEAVVLGRLFALFLLLSGHVKPLDGAS